MILSDCAFTGIYNPVVLGPYPADTIPRMRKRPAYRVVCDRCHREYRKNATWLLFSEANDAPGPPWANLGDRRHLCPGCWERTEDYRRRRLEPWNR